MLFSLIEEKNGHNKPDQQKREHSPDNNYNIDFRILILHNKAIVSNEYNETFITVNMAVRLLRMNRGILSKKLTRPNMGKLTV
jgi:hypothetical protein